MKVGQQCLGEKNIFRWQPSSERQEDIIEGLSQPIWNNLPKLTPIKYTPLNKNAVLAKANLKKLPAKLAT